LRASGYRLSAAAAAAEAHRNGTAIEPVKAAIDSEPVIAGASDVFEWFGGGGQAAGITVTPDTAMRSSTVWRCVTLISGAMMSAVLGVYERLPNGGRRYVADHEYNRFLQMEPNDDMSGPEMIELAAIDMLLRGQG